ncbi:hypothetical protein FRC07_009137 [Ceratobasidium sp. 392]|nr:hypothetical protein FRC07_009137 [Ceratobasidium sp. 392]
MLHCLKHEVETTKARLDELRSSNDNQALQAWMRARRTEVKRQKEHGDVVARFLKDELKQKWNEQVECRLLELGYAQKEADLPLDK